MLEAAGYAVAAIDGVARWRNQLYLVENDVAKGAGMERADAHLSAPFLREIAAGGGSQV